MGGIFHDLVLLKQWCGTKIAPLGLIKTIQPHKIDNFVRKLLQERLDRVQQRLSNTPRVVLKLDCINSVIASCKAHLGSLGANEPLKALKVCVDL
jgi:hypothetical protein